MNRKSLVLVIPLTGMLLLSACSLVDVNSKKTESPQNSNVEQRVEVLESKIERMDAKLDALMQAQEQ